MKNQKSLGIAFIISLCLTPSIRGQKALNNQEQRPNIIFILTDDQRYDALGYAGNTLISTPEMDKLAREGTYFKNAMVTTPICAASRASILTGLYERKHRFNFQTGNIRDLYMDESYPTILKNNGYTTAFFGKYGVRYDHLDDQFDEYESYDRNNAFKDRRGYYYKIIEKDTVHLTRYTGQKAIDFIARTKSDEPFCLSLSFSAPHAHDSSKEQYFWQESSNALLQNDLIPAPELADDKYFEAQPKFVRDGFNRLRWTWRFDTPEKYQHSVKGYYRMISGIDREIAKIRAELNKKGLDKNTVIIFMGDNGYFLGERQLAGKWLLYDNSIRVPLIIYDPRKKIHIDSDVMALNIDVPATILDVAGIERPKSWHGKSLMPIVANKSKNFNRDTVLIEHIWEFDRIPPSEGVRTDKWKYFRYVNDKSIEELYDLEADPKEVQNLAKDPKYVAKLNAFRRKTDSKIHELTDRFSIGPSKLSVNGIRKKVGANIINESPEYGWVVPDLAVWQSAYQILVASSEENLANNIGDIWDSGQKRVNTSFNIAHGGAPLNSGYTYYWKVRIWDDYNRVSEYSESQSFHIEKPVISKVDVAPFNDFDGEASSFTCSNESLVKIWDSCKTSFEVNALNEDNTQIATELDAYAIQLNSYAFDQGYIVPRQTIDHFMENPSPYTEGQLYMSLMIYADYWQTGNSELIKKYYKELKAKTLYELADQYELISTSMVTPEIMQKLGFEKGYKKPLIDIAAGSGDYSKEPELARLKNAYYTSINALYYQNMIIMAEFAKIMGKTEEAWDFNIRALKAKKMLNEKMFDKAKGVYVDGIGMEQTSLYANTLPIVFGMVPQQHVAGVVKHIKSSDVPINMEAYGNILNAMFNGGEADFALSLLTDKEDNAWYGKFISDAKQNPYAHKKAPAYVLSQNLWGIRPKTPGFGIASIKPQMGTLQQSSIKVPTIRGSIKGTYHIENKKVRVFDFEIPANMLAEFEITLEPGMELVHNGEKMNLAFDSVRLQPGKHQIKLTASNSF